MIPNLTAQQIASFAKNGSLELEELFTPAECEQYLKAIQATLSSDNQGRDLWRNAPTLKTLIFSRKLSTLALAVGGKPPLRIACDQWFSPTYTLPRPTKAKELFSIQGITAILAIRLETGANPTNPSPIGLLPFPQTAGSALLIQPNILLSWPPLGTGLYFIAYCQSNSVYIHNPNDPAGILLRRLGYGYGDPLNSDHHPTLRS